MTTVAYNHKDKQIAVDSRIIINDQIVSDDFEKFIIDGERMFFFCGKVCDYSKLIEADNGRVFDADVNATAIMIYAGEAYHCVINEKGRFEQLRIQYDFCLGRGDEVALTAMDYGATAKEAVEHAGKRTTSTGGKIRVYDIESAKFI